MFSNQHSQNSAATNSSSPGRWVPSPCRLGGALILTIIILSSCTIPTEDISKRQQIPAASIRQAIKQSVFYDDLWLLDNIYIAYTQLELESCLKAGEWIVDFEYVPDTDDCDDYAYLTFPWVRRTLRGIPFGFVIRKGKWHAENLWIDEDLNVWIIDLKKRGSELIPASGAFFGLVMI